MEPDLALRLALISAERLNHLANSQANRESIIHEADLLSHRLSVFIKNAEDTPYWIPGKDILPE
jgi:hypothetical protein